MSDRPDTTPQGLVLPFPQLPDYWRSTCPRCHAPRPDLTACDGHLHHYRCWSCGHMWGVDA